MTRRRIVSRDLFLVRWLSDVQLAPDGRRVACVETRLDEAADGLRSRILVIDTGAGDAVTSPSPDDAADGSPRWSPDGTRLVFVGRRGGEARLWIAGADGGSAVPMEGGPLRVSDPVWSPDGRSIAMSVTTPLPRDGSPLVEVVGDHYKVDGLPVGEGLTSSAIWVVAADGSVAHALTAGLTHDGKPAWSPDGRWVAFRSDRGRERASTQVTDLWLVAAKTAGNDREPPARLTDGSGPIAAFTWAPDGARIALLGHGERERQGIGWRLRIVHVADPGTGTRRSPVVPVDVSLVDGPPFALGLTPRSDDGRGMGDAALAWVRDPAGDRIWMRWADGGRGALGWVAPDGQWAPVVTGDRAVVSWSIASAAGTIAFVASDPTDPGEVSIATLDGARERRVSHRNDAWLADVELGTTELVRATGPGEVPLEGWLVRPPGVVDGPIPLIVSVHGGPHYPVGERFSFEMQRLAALGYAVLAGNPRGSLGYGDAFGSAIIGDWGGGDLADTLALTEAGAAQPGIDPERLAITGVSYGGYLTLFAISQDDRFRCAISENGISDLVSSLGTSEDGGSWWLSEMGGPPWERRADWVERSAIHHAGRITTPLLLLHAERDQNVSITQSEQLYGALRALRRHVEFVRVPGEGHLMDLVGSARFRIARMDRMAAFLAAFLAAFPARTL